MGIAMLRRCGPNHAPSNAAENNVAVDLASLLEKACSVRS
jgi:hypothetical protein